MNEVLVVFVDDDPGVTDQYIAFFGLEDFGGQKVIVHSATLTSAEVAENFGRMHANASVVWVIDSMMPPVDDVMQDDMLGESLGENTLMYAGVDLIGKLRSLGDRFRFVVMTNVHASDVMKRLASEGGGIPVYEKAHYSPRKLYGEISQICAEILRSK